MEELDAVEEHMRVNCILRYCIASFIRSCIAYCIAYDIAYCIAYYIITCRAESPYCPFNLVLL